MMGSLYYDLVTILRNAGCTVQENSITNGWQRRARSSGGFSAPPLAVWWHHTASQTAVNNDLNWQINGCDDAPVGNMLLDRTGCFWPVAGGASNCAGKGGPANFSRGVSPTDQGNTTGFQIEVANAGTGVEPWPQVQIDAYFRGSNALNAFVGNQPIDAISHNAWAPTRKIDPAPASAVQGPWKPRSCTSSGTWDLGDIRNECAARATSAFTPDQEDDMTDEQAKQLGELYTSMCSPQPGFKDPQGNQLNAAWAALWAENLIAGDIYKMLVDIQNRVARLEAS